MKKKISLLVTLLLASYTTMVAKNIEIKDTTQTTSAKTIKNMKPKIALISWTLGIDDLDSLFTTTKSLGIDYMQYSGDHTKFTAKEVAKKAKKYGITLLSYDPFNSKPPSKKDATLEKSVAFYSDMIKYGAELGVPMVTLQGLSFWVQKSQTYEQQLDQIVEAVKQLSALAEKYDILLTYEACNQYEIPVVHTADDLLYIYNKAGVSNLQLVLDSFHMNINEKDMTAPIYAIGDKLHSYHISDSNRGGIGFGKINYLTQYNAMQQIGFNGFVFLEIVIDECTPYKLPMSQMQMQQFKNQVKQSIAVWSAMSTTN